MWRSRQYDKQTMWRFDEWLGTYEMSSSPFQRSRMAVALLTQSINLAWRLNAISTRQKELVTVSLKQQRATTTMTLWLGTMLPAVLQVAGKEEVTRADARFIGMLMLLAWMQPSNERDKAIRQFLATL